VLEFLMPSGLAVSPSRLIAPGPHYDDRLWMTFMLFFSGPLADGGRGHEDDCQRRRGLGDHRDVRCFDLVDDRMCAAGEILRGRRDRVIVSCHEIPGRDRLPGGLGLISKRVPGPTWAAALPTSDQPHALGGRLQRGLEPVLGEAEIPSPPPRSGYARVIRFRMISLTGFLATTARPTRPCSARTRRCRRAP
jgi:hypothetical protein